MPFSKKLLSTRPLLGQPSIEPRIDQHLVSVKQVVSILDEGIECGEARLLVLLIHENRSLDYFKEQTTIRLTRSKLS
jgi:hypothetical protein